MIITKAVINAEARKWGIPPARLAKLYLAKHVRSELAAIRPAKAGNIIYLPYKPVS